MEQLIGVVERITFHNADNGYSVIKVKVAGSRDLVCCVGNMPGIQPGETIECQGNWSTHTVHGRQFSVEQYATRQPADSNGIRKYLGSGLIKGIGPVMADRIVSTFGEATLAVIDAEPARLREIDGIGPERAKQISRCWEEQRSIREVMIFLQQYEISPAYAQKIFKAYGHEAIDKLRTDPYCLARDIFGIGFKTADGIAAAMGIARDSSERIQAGIEYTLSELAGDGHVCYPLESMIESTATLLEVSTEAVMPLVRELEASKRVVTANLSNATHIWLRPLFLAETGIAREIRRLREASSSLRQVNTEKAVAWVQQELSLTLAELQASAVKKTLEEKIHIITGGPGTGKSTITRAILAVSAKLTNRILLAAPTGRAAKRMNEITYWPASTIHSLLEYSFAKGGFKRNHSNPLECDLLIVDEASMIDTLLMYHLLRAIPSTARLVLVGDINQLPSVGPGNVLRDLIASQTVAVSHLNEIFRQARGSQIVVNAHRVNQGEFPFLKQKASSDFFFLESEEPEEVREKIVGLVTQRLPDRYSFDPIDDIQVLAPMRKGVVGTQQLNEVLQQRLNRSQHPPLTRFGQPFFPGDKVMQTRNNYQKEVFNGDVGRISAVDCEELRLIVEFDGRRLAYEYSELDELILAYAVSIHKYQGSECPCIVMPVHTTHFKLLHRNLLYTGITRGKKLVVLVGTKKAVAIAVNSDDVRSRHTGLREALQQVLQ